MNKGNLSHNQKTMCMHLRWIPCKRKKNRKWVDTICRKIFKLMSIRVRSGLLQPPCDAKKEQKSSAIDFSNISWMTLDLTDNYIGSDNGRLYDITQSNIDKVPWCHMERGLLSKNLSTHWGRAKMTAILHTLFLNPYSWMKMLEFQLQFHWSLLLRILHLR